MQRTFKALFRNFQRLPIICNAKASSLSSSTNNRCWDIIVSVGILRNPFIAPPMTAVEKEYANTSAAIEYEGSLLSDFELREKEDKRLLEKRALLESEGKDLSDLDEKIGISALLMKDDWEKSGKTLLEKNRIGDLSAVQKNSVKSLWRAIDRQAVLLVKQRFSRTDNYESPWALPQTTVKPGETLRESAERCISEITNNNPQISIIGNAPFSVFTYRYPKNLQLKNSTGAIGGKVFFFTGDVQQKDEIEMNKDEIADYKWVVAEEFYSIVKDQKYRSALTTLFIE